MYKKIGGKLKITAIIVGITVSVIGIVQGINVLNMFNMIGFAELGGMEEFGNMIGNVRAMGLIYIIGGPLLGWVVALLIYGFGELIEKTQGIHKMLAVKNSEKQENYGGQEEKTVDTATDQPE